MNPGMLRHLIVIEEQVLTLDSMGQRVSVWTEFARVRASVVRNPGHGELFASAGRQERTHTVFQTRFQEGIKREMRIIFDARRYNIKEVLDVKGLRTMLEIVAMEEGDAP